MRPVQRATRRLRGEWAATVATARHAGEQPVGVGRHCSSKRLTRRLPIGILIIMMFLVGTTTFALAHGGGANKIHSCVTKIGGVVRIVEPSNNCLLTESPLDW